MTKKSVASERFCDALEKHEDFILSPFMCQVSRTKLL